ncbi:Smr/MutS family protein [bacterium]|nr:Smr/MutS family protein [bacterium]
MMDKTTDNHYALEALNFHKVLDAVADRTGTDYGRAHIFTLAPGREGIDLEAEFDRIEALTGAVQRGEPLPLGGIHDVDAPLKRSRTEGTHLEVNHLLDIGQLAVVTRKLRQFIEKRRQAFEPLMHFAEIIEEMPKLERDIFKALDENTAEVRDEASAALRKIRREIESSVQRVRKRLDSMVRQFGNDGYLLESGYTIRDGRYALAVKQQHKNRVRGIVHGLSASGGTVFIEPDELVELGNEVRRLAEEEAEEVRRILTLLTDTVREHVPALRAAIDAVTQLDSLQARARFAWDVGGMRPAVRDGQLNLVSARHPLLVLRKGLEETVPLDLSMNSDDRTLIITGPNAGGKTVALKTVGLVSAMIHSGIWPSAGDGTVVPPIEQWHVVIGDDQSLDGDLSSFSGHLEKLKTITHEPRQPKLVLIDEIASGTDPTEGAGLAMALLEEAVAYGWWSIVTTHMGALKAFAHRTDGVRNGSMQFDREHLTPTYRFQPDLPGSSYALEIAQRVGMPEAVVNRARDYVGEERLRLEDLIEELTERLQTLQDRERDLATQITRNSGLEKILQERIERLESQKAEKMDKAAAEAEKLLAEANRAIELSVKEIKEKQAASEAIKAARERVEQQKQAVEAAQRDAKAKRRKDKGKKAKPESFEQLARQAAPRQEALSEEELTAPIQVGDEVRLESGIRAEVLALKGDKVQVTAGSLKIWMSVADVEKVRKHRAGGGVKVMMDESASTSSPADAPPVRTELKLLGMRAEQAEISLDKYLEKIALSGMPYARIVHGKGTGALRSMVQEVLEDHPLVASYRFGDAREGGDGVTIVELKE